MRENPKPLTLEELKDHARQYAYGTHIWVAGLPFNGDHMAAVTDVMDDVGLVAVWAGDGERFEEKDYGKTWVAWRYNQLLPLKYDEEE